MLYTYGYPKPLCGGTGYLEAFLGVEADGSHEKENIVI
jgi:hypothetical protein